MIGPRGGALPSEYRESSVCRLRRTGYADAICPDSYWNRAGSNRGVTADNGTSPNFRRL